MAYALISVSDKTGIVDFAKGIAALGIEIISTGGTANLLRQAGCTVIEAAEHTGFPEMLDGRVKTLHPKIHAGILARRDRDDHRQALRQHAIDDIDLVVVNLYPFVETVADPAVSLNEAIEQIDIGGPAMLRSAAKNHASVLAVCDPADYAPLLAELAAGGVSANRRRQLAAKVFTHTARYDGAIANWLTALPDDASDRPDAATAGLLADFPSALHLGFDRVETLRYGENPHQLAAFYRDCGAAHGFASFRQWQGKALSYNNIADADAAWGAVQSFAEPAVVIVKHANPCGVAVAHDLVSAYRKAFATDPSSAFGGILAVNRPLDAELVDAMAERNHFVEVIVAPEVLPEARQKLAAKANLRLLTIPAPSAMATTALAAWDVKRVSGGLLVQSIDKIDTPRSAMKVVSHKQPSEADWSDLLFAWKVVQHVKSNAIVFCGQGQTLGIGAGQMSRVDSTRIASLKATQAGLTLAGSVVASDAFFPFRDGVDVLAEVGARAVIHPGGSVRDTEVIDAANDHGLIMVVTGVRHFRH